MRPLRARPEDPSFAEASLLSGLRADLFAALDAVERGAREEATEILGRRLAQAVALDDAEAAWTAAAGSGGPEGDELLSESLQGLQEAAELAGSAEVQRAAEDLTLLVSAGQADVAASVLAEAAVPIRRAMARQEDEWMMGRRNAPEGGDRFPRRPGEEGQPGRRGDSGEEEGCPT